MTTSPASGRAHRARPLARVEGQTRATAQRPTASARAVPAAAPIAAGHHTRRVGAVLLLLGALLAVLVGAHAHLNPGHAAAAGGTAHHRVAAPEANPTPSCIPAACCGDSGASIAPATQECASTGDALVPPEAGTLPGPDLAAAEPLPSTTPRVVALRGPPAPLTTRLKTMVSRV